MPGNREISELARWADESTWAGSVFLFPDASQGTFPSTFRAISRRALWVDWSSGLQVNSSQALADEWWRRWEDTMAKPLTPGRLQPMLALPIDYYVLQKRHQLTAVSPSFTTTNLVVYDADALRSSHASSARQ